MNEAVDYTKVLDDLLAERERLNAMIDWVKERLGRSGADDSKAPRLELSKDGKARFPRLVKEDAFFKMSVSEAIKAYLDMMKRPQTAREITDGLIAGGLAHKAKNLYQTVFPTLGRMARDAKEVDKLTDGKWGLSEWYSGSRGRTAEPATEGDK
jgi:hypothetical protein